MSGPPAHIHLCAGRIQQGVPEKGALEIRDVYIYEFLPAPLFFWVQSGQGAHAESTVTVTRQGRKTARLKAKPSAQHNQAEQSAIAAFHRVEVLQDCALMNEFWSSIATREVCRIISNVFTGPLLMNMRA